MIEAMYIGIGGFLGAICRFFISKLGNNFSLSLPEGHFFAGFPIGTLLVNVTGSFILAFINYSVLEGRSIPNDMKNMMTIGFIGAYTTMSTFAFESFRLGETSQILEMCVNIILNVGLCLFAIYLGRQTSLLLFK